MMTAALAKNGASKVYILGRRGDVLEQAASSIGPNVVPIVCDVSSKESLQKAAASIESEVGYINLLVCNAGIGGPQVKPAEPSMSAADWAAQHLAHSKEDYTKVFDVNVSSVWYTAMSFLKLLELGNQKGNVSQTSQVITTSSIGAFNKTAPGGWAYGQSKIAATLLGKHLAATLPQWNIRSNVIAPGCRYSSLQSLDTANSCSVSERDGSADC
jgi:NAD(P)-dependent dehydrogenase (short-subunit alcohol dehydrogenase family)